MNIQLIGFNTKDQPILGLVVCVCGGGGDLGISCVCVGGGVLTFRVIYHTYKIKS